MNNIKITSVPDEYKKAVNKELQGTITEVSYRVQNYINQSREFATNQNISSKEVGREVATGIPIEKKCNIYLPEGYKEDDKDKKYNVLYLLHGVGGNRYEWLDGSGNVDGNSVICNIFDNLIANGDIDPLVIVFPDGRSACDWTDNSFNSEGTNMLGFYYFDYELRYDLIPFIESKYNVYANIKDTTSEGIAYNRMHRAIAGLSMGGMQCLNLIVGGYRCDSKIYTGTKGGWSNGLDKTVLALGMKDLFDYIGAFSNAPTSSDGEVLGSSIKSCRHRLHLLYVTCGDADEIASQDGYAKAIDSIIEAGGDNLGDYYQILIEGGVHDFNVWNNGAYNFIRLCFGKSEGHLKQDVVKMTLHS
jgi:S-formylglutathione hydrolase FrmB